MKVKKCVYKCLCFHLILFEFLLLSVSVEADIGGGSGELLTPYVPGTEVTEEEVSEIKKLSMTNRVVPSLHIVDTNVKRYGEQVGLAFVKNRQLVDNLFFEFRGQEPGEKVPISVDFSNILRFTILEIKKRLFNSDIALIRIKLFPNISVRELLEDKPSYTKLVKEKSRLVDLLVELEQNNGELCLVGTEGHSPGQYIILSEIRNIELNVPVSLDYGYVKLDSFDHKITTIWWAVHSVIQDEEYPYKVFFMH